MKPVLGSITGSYMFGTNVPDSDLDIRGVHVPNGEDIVYQRVRVDSLKTSIEPYIGEVVSTFATNFPKQRIKSYDSDYSSLPLHRFLSLVQEGELTTIELLFSPKSLHVESMHDKVWDKIINRRDQLLSKKIGSAVEFCRGVSRKFHVDGVRQEAMQACYDTVVRLMDDYTPKTRLGDVREHWRHLLDHEYVNEIEVEGSNVKFLEVCNRKFQFTSSLHSVFVMMTGVLHQYKNRDFNKDKMTPSDWKDIMHAIRIAHQSLELAETNHITFPRPDAKRLLSIRNGNMELEPLMEELTFVISEFQTALDKSSLPETVSGTLIYDLIAETYKDAINETLS